MKARLEPEEGSGDALLQEMGIDTDDESEPEWMDATINLDHVSAFYRLSDDADGPIVIEMMGSEVTANLEYKVFLAVMKKLALEQLK